MAFPDLIEHPRSGVGGDTAMRRFLALLSAILRHESVERVGLGTARDRWDVWVMQRTEQIEDAEAIYGLEYAYLSEPDALPIDLHILQLDRIPEEAVPALLFNAVR